MDYYYRRIKPFAAFAIFIAIALSVVDAQKATEVAADFEQQLQQDESTRPIIYEIELVDWNNPMGKTFTGRKCNETDEKAPFSCDPLFKYNVEVLRNRTQVTGGAHIIVNQTCLTWPGKTPMEQWQRIGKDNYDDVDDIEKIGIVRLAPVPEGELQDVILRVQVLDRNHEQEPKNAIGYFMCILPGTSNGRYMKAKPFELRSEAVWSGPMHCFPAAHIDRFLAPYIDFDSQRDQELIVRYRVYHENDNKDTAAEHQQVEIEQMAAKSGTLKKDGDKKPRGMYGGGGGGGDDDAGSRGYRSYHSRSYYSRRKRSPGLITGFGYGYPWGGLGLGGWGLGGIPYGGFYGGGLGLGLGGWGLGLGGLGWGGYGGFGRFGRWG